jgi:hypothetical protein
MIPYHDHEAHETDALIKPLLAVDDVWVLWHTLVRTLHIEHRCEYRAWPVFNGHNSRIGKRAYAFSVGRVAGHGP